MDILKPDLMSMLSDVKSHPSKLCMLLSQKIGGNTREQQRVRGRQGGKLQNNTLQTSEKVKHNLFCPFCV